MDLGEEDQLRASPALQEADIVVVVSGFNGLVLANYLARAGLEVAGVECARTIDGGLSTEEITLPLFYKRSEGRVEAESHLRGQRVSAENVSQSLGSPSS